MPEKRKLDENDGGENDPSELGSGSFGTVHIVEENDETSTTGGGVVIKKCTFQKRRPDLPVPFLREFVALKALGTHANVINAFDFDAEKRTFRMERLSCSLFHHLYRVGQLSQDDAVSATLQIARGVAFLHDHGFVHRDLSSNNILVDTSKDQPRFVVGDFGTAVKYIPGREMTIMVTTIPFRAPEMMFSSCFYGKPVDVWALAILAIEMIHGKSFIHRNTNRDQLIRTFFLTGVPSASNWPDATNLPNYTHFEPMIRVSLRMNEDTEKLVKWLMAIDPSRRPLASEVVQRLNARRNADAPIAVAKTPRTRRANATPQTMTNVKKKKSGWTVHANKDAAAYKSTVLTANYHRLKAVDFLVANAFDLSMSRLSLHNSVCLLDAYVSLKEGKIPKEKLQSISLACLMVAAKLFDVKDILASEVALDTGTTTDELVQLELEVIQIAASEPFDTVLPHIDENAISKSVRKDSESVLGYLLDFSLLVLAPDYKNLAASVKRIAKGDDADDMYVTELRRLLGNKSMRLLEKDGPFAMGRHLVAEP